MKSGVLIADDHELIRSAMQALLSIQPDLYCVGHFGDLLQTDLFLQANHVDVVVVDLQFDRNNAFDYLRKWSEFGLKVVVSSAFPSRMYGRLSLSAGSAAFVHKSCNSDILFGVIRSVIAGKTGLLADDSSRNPSELQSIAGSLEQLSEREWDVFTEIGRGSTTSEISKKLFISAKTVETHRISIKRKLGIDSKDTLTSVAAVVTLQ